MRKDNIEILHVQLTKEEFAQLTANVPPGKLSEATRLALMKAGYLNTLSPRGKGGRPRRNQHSA
jgi:hypothetical protein